MNKLTEIKERLKSVKETSGLKRLAAREFFEWNAEKDMEYLISLLEEKDKALAFYADKNNYAMRYNLYNKSVTRIQTSPINEDLGDIARKALNTSSNQEGES